TENDFRFLKDCELKTDELISQPLSPTVISSELEFGIFKYIILGGFNKNNYTTELSAIVSPLGKSPNAKFSNEQLLISRRKLSYDLAPMSELFKSPSQGVVTTPKSTNKQHEDALTPNRWIRSATSCHGPADCLSPMFTEGICKMV
ncbi:hypothetical protein FWK35_00023711, partial [Aphis craccivora]